MSSQTTTDLGHQEIAVVIFATFFTVLALVGNAVILYSHVANKLLKYVHSLFIFNMAICDGLLAIAILLLYAGHVASKKSQADRCHSFLSIVDALQLEQSFILILLISDRIVLIRKGLLYNRQRSIPHVWLLVILTWAFSIFLGLLDLVTHHEIESGNTNYFCDERPEIAVGVMSLSIMFLLTASSVMFVYLWVKVRMLRSRLSTSTGSRHRLLTQRRSIGPYPSTVQARDDVDSPFVPASSVNRHSEEVASQESLDQPIIIESRRSLSLTLTRKKSGGSIRSTSSVTPVSQLEVKSAVHESDARSDPGGLEVKGREALKAGTDTRGRQSLKQDASGVNFAMSPSIMATDDSRRPGDPAFSNASETRPIGDQRRLSGVNSESRKISWPKQSDQSMLPILLRRMTRTGQREVYAILEVSLLLVVQILFVLPQCLASMLLFAGAGDFHIIHFYLQWMAFGPTLVYPALYVTCRRPTRPIF